MKKIFVGIAVLSIMLFSTTALATDVRLAWDHNDPLPEGYRVYQRVEGQAYDYATPVWEGTENETTNIPVEVGEKYFWVVRAFEGDLQSADSNEVEFTVPLQKVQGASVIYIIYNNGGTVNFNGAQ